MNSAPPPQPLQVEVDPESADRVLNSLMDVVRGHLEVETLRAGGACEKRLLHLWKRAQSGGGSEEGSVVVVPAADPMAFQAKTIFPDFHIFAWAGMTSDGSEVAVNLVLTTRSGTAVSSQLLRAEELAKGPELLQSKDFLVSRLLDNDIRPCPGTEILCPVLLKYLKSGKSIKRLRHILIDEHRLEPDTMIVKSTSCQLIVVGGDKYTACLTCADLCQVVNQNGEKDDVGIEKEPQPKKKKRKARKEMIKKSVKSELLEELKELKEEVLSDDYYDGNDDDAGFYNDNDPDYAPEILSASVKCELNDEGEDDEPADGAGEDLKPPLTIDPVTGLFAQ